VPDGFDWSEVPLVLLWARAAVASKPAAAVQISGFNGVFIM
jgi:hypothetical protein